MAYTPPAGNKVALTFRAGVYVPPPGNKVALELVPNSGPVGDAQYVFPSGFDALSPGDALAWLKQRTVSASGIQPPAFSSLPEVFLKSQFVSPPGWFSGSCGVAKVWNSRQILLAQGSELQVFGDSFTWNRNQTLSLGGIPSQSALGFASIWNRNQYVSVPGASPSAFGVAFLSGGVREVQAWGIESPGSGIPWASFSPRIIDPAGIGYSFSSRATIGYSRSLSVLGFDASGFGTRIIPESQTVLPSGFAESFGLPTAFNRTGYLRPVGFKTFEQDAQRWGAAIVWNLRQIITQTFDPDNGLSGERWSQWTAIENRNRVIHTHSTAPGALPSPTIENGARAIIPSGIAAPETGEFYKAGLVAYRIRYFPMEGISPPLLSRWSAIHNDARVISPRGISSQFFGSSNLTKTRRYFDRIGGFNSAVAGYPMISFKIREVTFESRYGIAPPSIKLPEVKLRVRYIDGIGFEASRMGWPAFSIHWNRMTPRWTDRDIFGDPAVKNVTPEVVTYGRCAEEFGDTAIRTQWREIVTLENYPSAVGVPKIADRKQRVVVSGLSAVRISDHLKVSKLTEDLPAAQTILPGGVVLNNAFGFPALNQQVVFVPDGNVFSLFGLPVVTANSIRVEPGVGVQLIPEPMVSLKNREIKVSAFSSEFVYEPSPVRVSPHTIYAMTEATEQAIANHRPGGLHWIDHDPSGYRVHGGVGSPTLTLRHRRMFAQGHYDEGVGVPEIGLHRRYVAVPSIKSFRNGFHEVWGGIDEILVEGTPSDAVVSAPTVSRPPYVGPQTLFVQGLEGSFGGSRIELFNRALNLTGFDSLAMGESSGSDVPYAWRSLHVGEPMPTLPAGRDMSTFGSTWISSRVRGIEPEGTDFFVCDYDFLDFSKRMRVTQPARPKPATQTAWAKGFCAFLSSASNARPGAAYIRPDGNADMFRKGAF